MSALVITTRDPGFSEVVAPAPRVLGEAAVARAPRAMDAPYQTQSASDFFARAHLIMVILFGLMMTSFTFVFFHTGEAMLNIVVCIVYGVIYFGTPALILKVAHQRDVRAQPAADDDDDRIRTFTGRLKRSEAYAQILCIPAMMAIAGFTMSIIYHLA